MNVTEIQQVMGCEVWALKKQVRWMQVTPIAYLTALTTFLVLETVYVWPTIAQRIAR
ncbi:hypothetical protein [Paraburkholderia fungorum]|uniref:hypothetical protein n=1 Tax=Paraburkholderia fungorum TaxID=134537 RepID=UPI000A54AB6A|nr:hypothetical protein [Paraburkholderia fungorum]